jgi:WD40 repeat protein
MLDIDTSRDGQVLATPTILPIFGSMNAQLVSSAINDSQAAHTSLPSSGLGSEGRPQRADLHMSDGKLEMIDIAQNPNADIAFSPDGKFVAVAAADAAVHIWEWQRNHKFAVLRRHVDSILSSIPPDGNSIITVSDDSTVAIFPCTTCQPFEELLKIAKERDHNRRPGSGGRWNHDPHQQVFLRAPAAARRVLERRFARRPDHHPQHRADPEKLESLQAAGS